jgi:pimeloyl-ACP methyl ester carboxylesterase
VTAATIESFALTLPNGMRLACRACGAKGAAARIVLLHGFPEAGFVWDEVMQLLAPLARCVAPDQRGYGGSTAPTEVSAYRARHLMGDIEALIEALGPAPIDLLVAHDWGGAIAWNLAAARPQLFKRLLIVNSPHPGALLRELRDNPRQRLASAYMNEFVANGAAERLAADDHALLWPFFGTSPQWLTPELRQRYRDTWARGLDGALNWYRATPLRPPPVDSAPVDLPEHLGDEIVNVKVPTTVIWGEADKALLPGLLDGLENWVSDLKIIRVAGATHWIVHEQPQLIADTIIASLAGLPASATESALRAGSVLSQ